MPSFVGPSETLIYELMQCPEGACCLIQPQKPKLPEAEARNTGKLEWGSSEQINTCLNMSNKLFAL